MSFAEQLKSQLDIVDVVGQYVRLKRQGAGPRWVGLCPFHSEKTPSFGVHSVLQIYKCFGCDASGDVFKFVMEREGLTFPEALKALAERYGIAYPERERFDDPEARRRSAVLEVHESAAEIFQANLRSADGADARRYLESRGVGREAIEIFRLGLSDGSGQQLISRLHKFGPELLEESGLFIKRQDGSGFYDRFRSRLMFPIHSESGKVIAFGGRALRANDEPKYLNSPETRIYKKSHVLFNLHRAKIDARKHDRMILVEGYMDVMGVFSAGIHEVVASSGTALSTEQVRAIKRQVSPQQSNAGTVILNFDPDPAGARSTERYISMLLGEGLRVRVLQLPNDFDPDEYIKNHGADAYQHLLEQSPSYFHWLADRAKSRFDTTTAEGRVDAFRFLAPAVQQITDRIERNATLTELAEYLKVDRQVLRDSVKSKSSTEPPNRLRNAASSIPPNEKLMFGCAIVSDQARSAVLEFLRRSDTLPLLELRPIFDAMIALEDQQQPFAIESVSDRLDERMRKLLVDLTFAEFGFQPEEAVDQALRCLEALEGKGRLSRCEALRQRIRALEREGNLSEALRMTDEMDKLKREIAGT
jgi:DNA primase